MEKVNYLLVVSALEELVQRAMELNIPKETPWGAVEQHQISGVRMLYLIDESYQQTIFAGEGQSVRKVLATPQLLISLFYQRPFTQKGKKQEKLMKHDFVLSHQALKTPNGILQIGWRELAEQIGILISDFYASKVKDNRFYQEAQSEAIRLAHEEFQIPCLQEIPKRFSAYAEDLSTELYQRKEVVSTESTIVSSRKLWIVVDHKGRRVIDHRDACKMVVNLEIVNQQNRLFSDAFSIWKDSFEQIVRDQGELQSQIQDFLASRERKQLESGIYPLLFTPAAVGTLFHEALAGHMLSGHYIVNQISSVFAGKLHQSIASEKFMNVLKELTIWDAPRDEDMIASYRYDMEGEVAQNVRLIHNGVLENYLLDRNSAARLKLKNNGHCLAGNLKRELLMNGICLDEVVYPEPRVSNLKIESSSKLSLSEMKSAFFDTFGYVLWVDSHNGKVNVETGTFELSVDYLIKEFPDGRKEYYHGGVFSANLTDFLSAIVSVSNHYARNQGYCGALSGHVPTDESAPAMGVHGVNWVPNPLPEREVIFNIKRDKFLPGKSKTTKH